MSTAKRRVPARLALLAASLLFLASTQRLVSGPLASGPAADLVQPAANPAIALDYAGLPLGFEANRGQAAAAVQFLSQGNNFSLYLGEDEAVLALRRPVSPASRSNPAASTSAVIHMRLAGDARLSRPAGENLLPGTVNYFLGDDPSQWQSGVPTYSRVRYPAVYPGVDLVYYGNQRQLEYDFIVAPGADPARIHLRFAGQKHLRINAAGDLVLQGTAGQALFRKPAIYQSTAESARQPVDGRFIFSAKDTVAFAVGRYDRARPLIIDPVLAYSTYLGGTGDPQTLGTGLIEGGTGIAVDSAGNAYVVGNALSANFPVTKGAFQTKNNAVFAGSGGSVFISKFNSTGTALLYSTYLGGTGLYFGGTEYGETAGGVAVDGQGNVYVAGTTFSTDFPVTSGAFETANKESASGTGLATAFVTKLAPAGDKLVYSTYLGGTDASATQGISGSIADAGTAIAIDPHGDAFVTGYTFASDFPVSNNAYQTTNNAFNFFSTNCFVAKLNPAGSAILYSTYLGGSGGYRDISLGDLPTGIALDSSGNAYVTGLVSSFDFPTTPGAFQVEDGSLFFPTFVTKFNANGTGLVYSTLVGGTGFDSSTGIAVDASGNAYEVGYTGSQDFPVTAGSVFPAFDGNADGFLVKLNSAGSQLKYATSLGDANVYPAAVTLDSAGHAFVVGSSLGGAFPVTGDAIPTPGPFGGFLAKFNATASAEEFATLFGGYPYGTQATAVALDASGSAYVTGNTLATNFPNTSGAYQVVNRGAANSNANAFVSKFALGAESTDHFGTTITVNALAPLVQYRQPVTLTASVTSAANLPMPTGKIVLSGSYCDFASDPCANAPTFTGTLNAGNASWTTATLAPGKYSYYGSYLGDGTHLSASTGNFALSLTVLAPPAQLTALQGMNQPTGVYGRDFQTLGVLVNDAYANPIPGITVSFSGAGLAFNPAFGTTDINGLIFTTPTPLAAGHLVATASVPGLGKTLAFPLAAAPAPLTVTVNPPRAWRLYAAANAAFTDTVTGLVGSDTATVKLQTAATPLSPVGAYPVTASVTGSAIGNYTVTINPGVIDVYPAPLIVVANNLGVTYGQVPGSLSYRLIGLLNGDTSSATTGAPILSTVVTAATPAGAYPILVQLGTLKALNYALQTSGAAPGTVQVYKAPLTATANNLTITEGSPLPALTYSLTGFVNGDKPTVASGSPLLATTAAAVPAAGHYPITLQNGTLSAANYFFKPVGGTLTVLPK